MTTIEKRIADHTENREKLMRKIKVIESDLNNIQDKIMFHNTAIHNLRQKQGKICLKKI